MLFLIRNRAARPLFAAAMPSYLPSCAPFLCGHPSLDEIRYLRIRRAHASKRPDTLRPRTMCESRPLHCHSLCRTSPIIESPSVPSSIDALEDA
jgi:hypothetical protein